MDRNYVVWVYIMLIGYILWYSGIDDVVHGCRLCYLGISCVIWV